MGSIFFAINSVLVAQPTTLSGYVLSDNGDAISGANIYISESLWAISDADGSYQFELSSDGSYTIKVSHISYKAISKDISVESGIENTIDFTLEKLVYKSSPAVVTASRTVQDIEDVTINIDVISEDEIQNSGSISLKDILLEQPGISLSPNEGNAIQIQGFESDYTLILIDGQPLVGRIRGALDISRINTSNIQQIEIVKGPSSALWGSDALAGVINIITKKPDELFTGRVFTEYGSRASYNVGADVSFNVNKISGNAGFSAYGSDGFDLSETEFGNNQNPYDNVTLNTAINYDFSDLTSLNVSGRYYKNNFSGLTLATVQGQEIGISEDGWQDDLSLNLRFDTSPFSRFQSTAIVYTTLYEDYTTTNFEDPSQANIINNNQQGYSKAEIQNNYTWLNNDITTFGAGVTSEFVRAERFQGKRNQGGLFVFAQHQFLFQDKLSLIAGARLDNHSSYDSYLSPKLSFKYDLNQNFTFRASVGRGFKAPDFRTLYLNFDNSGSGYLLYGVKNIGAELANFDQQGLILLYNFDANSLATLEPEYSTAYNVGFSFKTTDSKISSRVNLFRNNAQNLIEALEVAELTDGNTVFGYVNINKAKTQGVETEASYHFNNDLTISLGYQYLDAVQIITDERTIIENGAVITKDVEIEVPLPSRPEHSGTFKVFYTEPVSKTEISLRGILQSRYFFRDRNANLQADSNEYTDDFSIWNLSISRPFGQNFRAQLGINNLFDYTDSEYLKYQPGTTFLTKIIIEF